MGPAQSLAVVVWCHLKGLKVLQVSEATKATGGKLHSRWSWVPG